MKSSIFRASRSLRRARSEIGVAQQAAGATPAFPGATWFTTDCTNKVTAGRPDGDASVDMIVIHDTEGGWDASVATLQNDSGKSVHYIVDADGKRVGQFRHETDTTWHAGSWEYNKHSVGIEHVGFASNASGYSDGEYQKSVELVKSIRTRWQVPLDRSHIVGHYQIPDGDHIAESSAPCSAQLDTCENSANSAAPPTIAIPASTGTGASTWSGWAAAAPAPTRGRCGTAPTTTPKRCVA